IAYLVSLGVFQGPVGPMGPQGSEGAMGPEGPMGPRGTVQTSSANGEQTKTALTSTNEIEVIKEANVGPLLPQTSEPSRLPYYLSGLIIMLASIYYFVREHLNKRNEDDVTE